MIRGLHGSNPPPTGAVAARGGDTPHLHLALSLGCAQVAEDAERPPARIPPPPRSADSRTARGRGLMHLTAIRLHPASRPLAAEGALPLGPPQTPAPQTQTMALAPTPSCNQAHSLRSSSRPPRPGSLHPALPRRQRQCQRLARQHPLLPRRLGRETWHLPHARGGRATMAGSRTRCGRPSHSSGAAPPPLPPKSDETRRRSKPLRCVQHSACNAARRGVPPLQAGMRASSLRARCPESS